MNFSKEVEDLSVPLYKICPYNNNKELRVPSVNTTLVNISLSNTLKTYPYLVPNMDPYKISELLDNLPTRIK